jgi:hypothetical protein
MPARMDEYSFHAIARPMQLSRIDGVIQSGQRTIQIRIISLTLAMI